LDEIQTEVQEKGGKPDRNPYLLPYGLRNPYRNLKSENSVTSMKLYVQEFGFWKKNCHYQATLGGKMLLPYPEKKFPLPPD